MNNEDLKNIENNLIVLNEKLKTVYKTFKGIGYFEEEEYGFFDIKLTHLIGLFVSRNEYGLSVGFKLANIHITHYHESDSDFENRKELIISCLKHEPQHITPVKTLISNAIHIVDNLLLVSAENWRNMMDLRRYDVEFFEQMFSYELIEALI